MPNIQINIKNKVARADRAIIVCDNSDYIAVFDFDAEWDEYTTKTARFVYGGRYTDVVFTGNSCHIPEIHDTRSLTIGVYAGDLHTTTPAYVSCVPSILCCNGIPADPTPDVYAQIMELLGKISDESVAKAVTDALEQAKVSGEFDGEKGNDGISPAVSVTAITGGNRVTVTDAEGAKTFDVMDGAQGASGADGKDYVLTDTDKQEIAKTAASLVDVPSVQPDWNQNDSTQPDYVKNRPFYTGDPVKTEIIPETTVTFSETGGSMEAAWPESFDLVDGQTYTISWDGTDYVCTGILFNGAVPVLGNLGIIGLGDDTGEPFIFLNQGQWFVGSTESATEHIISISGFAQEAVKIDEKYLPESAFTNAEWSNISNKIVDYKQQSLSLSASGEPITIRAGASYSKNRINDNLKFEDGMAYEINGNITLHNTESKDSSTLDVNGSYICSNGYVVLGSCYDIYFHKYIEVELYSSSSDDSYYYHGKLGASAAISSTEYTFDINITVTAEARQLPDICIGENIQRVGDDVIIQSSTPDSTKKFKITVDDSGAPTITDESDSTNTWKPTNLPTVTASDAGKFLRVSDTGEWVAETILSASGVSF